MGIENENEEVDFINLSNGGKVPKDGSWIPRDKFNEAINKVKGDATTEREARIRLEEQVKALQSREPAQQQPPAKTYTLGELRQAVEKEAISQEEADRIYEHQMESKFDKKLTDSMLNFKQETTGDATISSGLQSYIDLLPDIEKEGSDNRVKLSEAYNRLTQTLGVPEANSLADRKMQLAALQSTFGPLNALKAKQSSQRAADSERETHQEYGSDRDSLNESDSKFYKSLSAPRKKYYSKMIDSGQYKDWKAVEAEMKYAR